MSVLIKETRALKNSMKFLPAGISLFAGLAVSIAMLISRANSLKALILVFLFLLIFYVIGLILRAVLIKLETKPEKEEDKKEQTEDITTENEEN